MTKAFNRLVQVFSVDVKIDEFVLLIFFSPKFDWGSYVDSIAKTTFEKMKILTVSMKSLSSEVAPPA